MACRFMAQMHGLYPALPARCRRHETLSSRGWDAPSSSAKIGANILVVTICTLWPSLRTKTSAPTAALDRAASWFRRTPSAATSLTTATHFREYVYAALPTACLLRGYGCRCIRGIADGTSVVYAALPTACLLCGYGCLVLKIDALARAFEDGAVAHARNISAHAPMRLRH